MPQVTKYIEVFLPSGSLSRVIKDAITVVVSLGKRYLWVDQYCVNQPDENIKATQVREMDRVYAGAYVTIVVCAGEDANSGLPEISRERKPRPSAILPNLELVTSLPALSVAIQDTKWNTRGWTYEEAVLSRRCLFFTDRQVYFACTNMSCSEADGDARGTCYPASHRIPMDLGKRIFHCEHQPAEDITSLFVQITEYSGRSLTYPEDILDALRGLLRRSQFYTYYGVSIVPREFKPGQSEGSTK